jgi:hypothetical protein
MMPPFDVNNLYMTKYMQHNNKFWVKGSGEHSPFLQSKGEFKFFITPFIYQNARVIMKLSLGDGLISVERNRFVLNRKVWLK